MPFPSQFSLTPGEDAYIKDPDPDFQAQYRCRILSVNPLHICLFPDANTEPDFNTLPPQYHLSEGVITPESIYLVPLIQPPVIGYAEALRNQNADPGIWTPATPSPMTGIEKGTTPGTKGEGQVEPDPNQNLAPPPNEAFQVQPGEVLEVAQTDHSFWKDLIGKDALVLEVPDPSIVNVEIEGLPYTNVDTGRFKRKDASVTGPEQSEEEKRVVAAAKWQGQNVHIKHAAIDSSFRGLCETVTDEGVKLQGIEIPIPWAQIGNICSMDEEATPGDDKDKARVDKKKADEAATREDVINDIQGILEKRAEKETLGKRDYTALMDRWELLRTKIGKDRVGDRVLEIDAILLSDKVTKKEALGKREYRPLVKKWREYLGQLFGAGPATEPEPVQQMLPGTETPPTPPTFYEKDIDAARKAGYKDGFAEALRQIKDRLLNLEQA